MDGGPWPLALTGPGVAPDPAAVFTDVVRPLADALADQHSVSMRILWGNAASAVAGLNEAGISFGPSWMYWCPPP